MLSLALHTCRAAQVLFCRVLDILFRKRFKRIKKIFVYCTLFLIYPTFRLNISMFKTPFANVIFQQKRVKYQREMVMTMVTNHPSDCKKIIKISL